MFSFFKKKDVKSEIYVDELIKHQINPAINRRGKKIISETLLKYCILARPPALSTAQASFASLTPVIGAAIIVFISI